MGDNQNPNKIRPPLNGGFLYKNTVVGGVGYMCGGIISPFISMVDRAIISNISGRES